MINGNLISVVENETVSGIKVIETVIDNYEFDVAYKANKKPMYPDKYDLSTKFGKDNIVFDAVDADTYDYQANKGDGLFVYSNEDTMNNLPCFLREQNG